MAIQITPPPNLTVQQPPQVDALGQYAKFAQLKDLLGRQALLPLQVQQQQQENQQRQMAIQEAQIGLQNAQGAQKFFASPDDYTAAPSDTSQASAPAGTPAPSGAAPKPGFAESMLGLSSDDPLTKYVNGLVRAGVNPTIGNNNAMSIGKGLLDFRQTVAKATEEQQKVASQGLATIKDILTPIAAEKDLTKRQAMLNDAAPELQSASAFDPALHQAIMGADAQHIQAIVNMTGATKEIVEYGKAQGEASSAATTAVKGQLETAAVSPAQLKTFTDKIIPGFASLRPEQKSAFVTEAQTARTVGELNKVVERADATDKAEQMHADSLAQTKALAGTKFAEKGLEANDKTWSDAQHGYVTVASQVKLVKQALQEGADGNGLAASMGPTMTALGINSFNQMHRISPAEAQSAAMPGGYAERFNAWADKAFKGKLSPQVASEGRQLMDDILAAAHDRAVQATQMHAAGYGIPAQNMPAMDREGNVTTLDKVAKASGKGGGAGAAATGNGNALPSFAEWQKKQKKGQQ